jgi:hypothetical protein
MALTRFRLDGGTNQQAARKLLPTEGLLRRVVNLDLRRDNELGVRPGFTALATGVYGQSTATVALFDLFAYDDRLFGLGSLSTATTQIALYEYVGGVKAWRRFGSSTRFPGATRLREIGAPVDQEGGVDAATCAAYNGTVCLAYRAGLQVFGHVFRAADNATIAFERISGSGQPRALVTVGHKFHVVLIASSHIAAASFDPATSETFPPGGATALQSVDNEIFAAAPVAGATGGYVTVGCLAGNLVLRHYNDSHVQQMTRTVNTIVPNYLAIAADSTADRIVVGYLDNAGSINRYRTFSLTAGADVAGPSTISGSVTTGALSVAIDSAGTVHAAENVTSSTPRSVHSTNAVGTWEDTQISTEIFQTVANATPDNVTLAGFVYGTLGFKFGVTGLGVHLNLGGDYPGWFNDFGTAMEWPGVLGSLTQDSVTRLFYLTTLRQNNDLEGTTAVVEFAFDVKERRQSAIISGLLHIAGALPVVFDGQQPVEMSWGEQPQIYSLASSNTASGAITSSAAYFLQIFPEMVDCRGNVHRGPPSIVYSITTGAADDTITGLVGNLHSYRNAQFFPGSSYRMVICRTAALADKTAGENLYRETHVAIPEQTWGSFTAFTLITSDAGLRTLGETQGTIYTQGQTPIPHQAPPPSSYLWPTNERLAAAGLPNTSQWLQSKLHFPSEGTHFSDADLPQFQGSTDEAILGIAAIQGQIVAFTRRTISLWTGSGPDHSGQGEFSFSGFLSREGGINGADGWKSLCETDEGIFFQRDDEQICMIGHDGHADWTVGQNVRDELATYPVINAACFIRKKHQVVFAVENSAGNAGELLVYDLRRKQWFIWDIWAKSLAEYQGRLCYVDSAGAVFQQHATPGTGAMPNQSFETFDFDFGTGMSWGEIVKVGVVGTKIADCTATLDITFDSGLNYTTIETFTLTTANNYVANAAVNLEKAPPLRECSRFGLRFNVTGGSGTEGIRINEITLETTTAPGMARLPARDTH